MESTKGILFDYEWCTGCHSCEMACQMEHQFPVGQSGVFLFEVGPYQIDLDEEPCRAEWQYSYQIAFTRQCDLCKDRQTLGKTPTCVQHCQARCLEFGTLDELAKKLTGKSSQCLFRPL